MTENFLVALSNLLSTCPREHFGWKENGKIYGFFVLSRENFGFWVKTYISKFVKNLFYVPRETFWIKKWKFWRKKLCFVVYSEKTFGSWVKTYLQVFWKYALRAQRIFWIFILKIYPVSFEMLQKSFQMILSELHSSFREDILMWKKKKNIRNLGFFRTFCEDLGSRGKKFWRFCHIYVFRCHRKLFGGAILKNS